MRAKCPEAALWFRITASTPSFTTKLYSTITCELTLHYIRHHARLFLCRRLCGLPSMQDRNLTVLTHHTQTTTLDDQVLPCSVQLDSVLERIFTNQSDVSLVASLRNTKGREVLGYRCTCQDSSVYVYLQVTRARLGNIQFQSFYNSLSMRETLSAVRPSHCMRSLDGCIRESS